MKQTMTIPEAYSYQALNPDSVFILNGDSCTVYTGTDIQDDMRTANERKISVQGFRDRFTPAETSGFIDKTRTDNNVATLQFKLSTAQEPLDLDGASLQQGMLYLVAIGVLTEARRIEILS